MTTATPRIVDQAWLDDPTGAWTLEDATQRTFTPYTGLLSRGYGPGAVWVRLRLDPGADGATPPRRPDAPQRIVLRMSPAYLDHIEVFDPLSPPSRPTLTGDRNPPESDSRRSTALSVELPRGDGPRDIHIRLESTSTRVLAVQVLDPDVAHDRDWQEVTLASLFLAVLSVFLLWVALHWFLSPEPVLGAFVVKQVFAVAFSFLTLGLGRALLPASAWSVLDTATSASIVLVIATAGYFDYCLLKEYRPPAWARRAMLLIVAGALAQLPLLAMGEAGLALRNANALALGGLLLDIAMIALARPSKGPDGPVVARWILGVLYGTVALITGAALLQIFGLIRPSEMLLYTNSAHGFMTGVVMVIFLQVRAVRLARRQHQARLALTLAQDQARQERAYREDREKLLAMLAHELKTPLSTALMRIGPGTAHADAATVQALGEMNQVIDTAVIAGRLEDGRLALSPAPCDASEVVRAVVSAHPQGERVRLSTAGPASLHTDEAILRVILRNLVDNACKYSPPGSAVALAVQPCELPQGWAAPSPPPEGVKKTWGGSAFSCEEGGPPGVSVAVENDVGAAGMPDPGQVFDKYYRSAQARRQIGCGLGLYLAEGLSRSLGGSLRYAPNDQRVRFVVWLPLDGLAHPDQPPQVNPATDAA